MSVTATILGCGSSTGVPRVGGAWGACDPNEPRNRRRRCSLLVRKTGPNGETAVLIDTGPDMREQMLLANAGMIEAVLYTHEHADHLHGIDDLRGFVIKSRQRMPVYMDDYTFERAYAAFSYCFETPPGSGYPPILERHGMTTGEIISIDGPGGTLDFEPLEVAHGNRPAKAFRFSDIAYIPDVSHICEATADRLRDLQVLIIDCLRKDKHPTHFCFDDAMAWIGELKPEKAVLTNLNVDLDYNALLKEVPDGVVPAYDGMTLSVDCAVSQAPMKAHAG